MIKIKFKHSVVLWTEHGDTKECDFHGFYLYHNDGELKRQIAAMLRRMPRKWDRNKGQTTHIFKLKGVAGAWY